MYDSFIRLIADVELKKDTYGGLVRFKAWYDHTQNQSGVPHGNEANDYVAGNALSDRGFETLQKFDGIYLLDAYVYNTWKTEGGSSLNLRVGRQALNWGESLFIQGINQISPLDVPAFRRPGTEVKEALLPVGMVYANWGIPNGPSIEGFYQFQWQPTNIDACGTYFSSGGCRDRAECRGPRAATAAWYRRRIPWAGPSNLYVPLTDTKTPKNGGQGGVAIRYFVECARHRVRRLRDQHPCPDAGARRHQAARSRSRRRPRSARWSRRSGSTPKTSRSTRSAPPRRLQAGPSARN